MAPKALGDRASSRRPRAAFAHVSLGVAFGFVLGVTTLVLATPRVTPLADLRPAHPRRPITPELTPEPENRNPPLRAVFRAHAFEIGVGLVVGLIALGVTVFLFGRSG